MEVAKHRVLGSDFVGAFCITTDRYSLIPHGTGSSLANIIRGTLRTDPITVMLANSDMLGVFGRGNSNGIVLSNLVHQSEVDSLRSMLPDIRVGIIESDLNAIGNNILANDRIAFVNNEYTPVAVKQVSDALGVEVLPIRIGEFRTVGANNILTNRGMAVNNTVSDEEKEHIESILGIKTVRTTANSGSLSIGISVMANSYGVIAGDLTTGYELARITETLE
jgi:translation initiation factor 6